MIKSISHAVAFATVSSEMLAQKRQIRTRETGHTDRRGSRQTMRSVVAQRRLQRDVKGKVTANSVKLSERQVRRSAKSVYGG